MSSKQCDKQHNPNLAGHEVIQQFNANMPHSPGVYRMLDKNNQPLYVGKARDLKKRIANYTKLEKNSIRIQRMISLTCNMAVITTNSEAEALLLEANLIKKLKPRYNILLRDDKSYLMILLRKDHDYPQIIKHRGRQDKRRGYYFGPFASGVAVYHTIASLQRAFLLRNCSDSTFKGRTRPCLQYFIKRCSAPCVGKISRDEYNILCDQAHDFLMGKSASVQEKLARDMYKASENMDFEKAADYRDRIKALNIIQTQQDINLSSLGDADIVAISEQGDIYCVHVFFYRAGRNYGNRTYFPKTNDYTTDISVVLSAFIAQFYSDKEPPKQILCNIMPAQYDLLMAAFSERAGRKITISHPKIGNRKKVIDLCTQNAIQALGRKINETYHHKELLKKLADLLKIEAIKNIEIYDNSHIQGTNNVGALIAVDEEGFNKKKYRKFNIRDVDDNIIKAGDDYGMMREVIRRRFSHILNKGADFSEQQKWELPDVIILDGGKGQLSSVLDELQKMEAENLPFIMAVSKGVERNAGKEILHFSDGETKKLDANDPLQFFIQRMRDESHRFAIGTHRAKRQKQSLKSELDGVPNIGSHRKKMLLQHFGSVKDVKNASIGELSQVKGISTSVAEKIYHFFHE